MVTGGEWVYARTTRFPRNDRRNARSDGQMVIRGHMITVRSLLSRAIPPTTPPLPICVKQVQPDLHPSLNLQQNRCPNMGP
ncbi:hypothetical protein BC936DRAFT_147676 [Jimgerdemannia flammicorona]|uniref:Uncharacterized protein n=1 Tax=Jimgerdemannia flammicorona TaxID=994334 RepID=A0A433D4R9_9FUNG|nr:hypothetical protein BC936DRAFT_147676 [Jimgerdemannia flammicorona]